MQLLGLKLIFSRIQFSMQKRRPNREGKFSLIFSSFPLFKEYCDSFNYCSQCQNMMHIVCSLILTNNQMTLSNSAKSGDFICFDCRGQNDIAAILEDGSVLLGQIFELTTKTGFLTDDKIIDQDKYCRCLKEMMARDFPDWTTTSHPDGKSRAEVFSSDHNPSKVNL
uniref:Uncharacterized protein n=1 Tax=Romanomermis culicivorax TaxID=13658 RepID=A0A915IKL4_ROMCU